MLNSNKIKNKRKIRIKEGPAKSQQMTAAYDYNYY